MIYFDSAATTFQKPRTVADAMRNAMATMSSPGRGGYPAAMRAAEAAFDCRTELAELYHLENPEQVAFTMNATHGLNIAIKSLVPPGGKAVDMSTTLSPGPWRPWGPRCPWRRRPCFSLQR